MHLYIRCASVCACVCVGVECGVHLMLMPLRTFLNLLCFPTSFSLLPPQESRRHFFSLTCPLSEIVMAQIHCISDYVLYVDLCFV